MEKEKHHSGNAIVALLLLIVGISIGYAALSTTLIINGESTIKKATWDVHFENVAVKSGSVAIDTNNGEKAAMITDVYQTKVEYTISLKEPGDFYEFTVDVKNGGTLDTAVSSNPELTEISEYEKYLRYSVVWDTENQTPKKDDVVKSGKSRKVRVKVEYRTDISNSDLPTEDKIIDLKFSMNFIQAK